MNFKHLTDYIKERGSSSEEKLEETALAYLGLLQKQKAIIKSYPFGFSTYRKVGDALVVADIYLAPEFRRIENQKYGWQIFKDLRAEALRQNVSLIIGFSEAGGSNKKAGEIAMKTAGFVKAYETSSRDIYMRGVQ